MPEEERLELVTSVTEDYERELDNLHASLELLDQQIRDTGEGRDHIRIDVEAQTADAVAELSALEAGLEAFDDDITIGADTDFDNVLREGFETNVRGRGSQFIDPKGRFTSADTALDDRFGQLADAIDGEFKDVGRVDVDAGQVDVDAGHADVDAVTTSSEGVTDLDLGDADDILKDIDTSSVDIDAGHADVDAVTTSSEGVTGLDLGDADNILKDASDTGVDEGFDDSLRSRIAERVGDSVDDGDIEISADANRGSYGGATALTSGGRDDITMVSNEELRDLFGVSPDRLGEDRSGFDRISELEKRLIELDMDAISGERMEPFVEDADVGVDMDARRELFGEGGQSIDEAMDMPDLFGDRKRRHPLRRFQHRVTNSIDELDDFILSIRGLHVAFAAMLPLVFVLVGALPVAIAGIAALGAAALGAAVALGGIAGLGAMGMGLAQEGQLSMQPIMDRLGDLKDSFVEAFAPLAESFVPVIDDAITQLSMMMGPLSTASAALLDFRRAFSGFFTWLGSSFPSFVNDLLQFTNAMMPLLTAVGQWASGVDVFGGLASILNKTLYPLKVMGQNLPLIFSSLMKLSRGFAIAAAALFKIGAIITWPLRAFPLLGVAIGAVTGALFLFSGILGLTRVLITGVTGAALKLGSVMLTRVIPAIQNVIGWMQAYTGSTLMAYGATILLIGALTLGIVAVGTLATSFVNLGSSIRGARKELERFTNTKASLRGDTGFGSGMAGPGRSSGVYQDNSTTVINTGDRDSAARQQYGNQYEQKQQVDAVFGSG